MQEGNPYLTRLIRTRRLEPGRFIIEGDRLTSDFLSRLGICTVQGRTHRANDDFLHIQHGIVFRDETYNLFAVYDGVSLGIGNMQDGARASKKAATAVNEFFRDFSSLCRDPQDLVHSALDYANNALDKQTNATTAVLAFINTSTGVCYVGSVGDSRICVIRDGRIIDANKLHRHPVRKNVITRKLGPDPRGRINEERGDASIVILVEHDIVVLTTDGIETVTDEQILMALEESSSLQEFTDRLVVLGESKGDDRTIIAIPV